MKALDRALYSTGINQSNYSLNSSQKIKVYILHMYYKCSNAGVVRVYKIHV